MEYNDNFADNFEMFKGTVTVWRKKMFSVGGMLPLFGVIRNRSICLSKKKIITSVKGKI